jgi:hypothetical protein
MKRLTFLCLFAFASSLRAEDPQPKTAEQILRIVRLSYALQNHKMDGVLRDDASGRVEPMELNMEKQVMRFRFKNPPPEIVHLDLNTTPATLYQVRPGGSSEVPASHGAVWSGAVTLGWTAADLRVRLHLGPDRVSAFGSSPTRDAAGQARPALAPLSLAARDARIRLRAELVGVKLSLGELATLRPGDALRLEHRIDWPLTVSTAAGEPVCNASLGERDGRRAIRLMPTAPAPVVTPVPPAVMT